MAFHIFFQCKPNKGSTWPFSPTLHSHAFDITFTRTSPALGGITVISSSTKGTLGARATIALHLIGNPSVDILEIYFNDFVLLI